MGYRPISDVWMLTRAKLNDGSKYYGSYPGGFPERARRLLGLRLNEPLLHVCSGMIKKYPYRGAVGPKDKTLDLDASCKPDYLQDARDPWPVCPFKKHKLGWPGVLIDPPYSEEDAKNYKVGSGVLPTTAELLRRAQEVLAPHGKVGILHYIYPKATKGYIINPCAVVCVITGTGNRARVFTVYEKEA